jgi:hypothetical protein
LIETKILGVGSRLSPPVLHALQVIYGGRTIFNAEKRTSLEVDQQLCNSKINWIKI